VPGGMTPGREPVVAVVGSGWETVADVLLAHAEGHPPAWLCAELHARWPGATLVLVVSDERLYCRYRDGTRSTLGRTAGGTWTTDEAGMIARHLYRQWTMTRRR